MRLERYIAVLFFSMVMVFASCEKPEKAIQLPDKGSAQLARVDMGENYENQVFFDLENAQIVMTSKVLSWDLAFENGPNGYHVFVNGGKSILVYNAKTQDPTQLLGTPIVNTGDWEFDAPSALPDSTAIGEWRTISGTSKNDVYVIKLPNEVYKKIVIESVSATEYVLKYGDINDAELKRITIPKNDAYNYSYFSFDNGGSIPMPDPPKGTWDLVFTQYRYVYYELNNFPYLVNGALLNPYQTTAFCDSTNTFDAINHENMPDPAMFSNHRDVIGFAWKRYNFDNGRYETLTNKTYLIKNRNGQVWKLRFLDFYGPTGLKGSPTFEFERIY